MPPEIYGCSILTAGCASADTSGAADNKYIYIYQDINQEY